MGPLRLERSTRIETRSSCAVGASEAGRMMIAARVAASVRVIIWPRSGEDKHEPRVCQREVPHLQRSNTSELVIAHRVRYGPGALRWRGLQIGGDMASEKGQTWRRA